MSRKANRPRHPYEQQQIKEVDCYNHLGLHFSNDGSLHTHINFILEKAWTRINIMRELKYELTRKSLETVYGIHTSYLGIWGCYLG